MKYVTAYPPARAPRLLSEGVTKESVSAECRDAALAFLGGVQHGWDKLDLVLWLTGPYARSTRHAPRGERVVDVTADITIEDATIDELLAHVRGQLVTSLEQVALDWSKLDFADEALERGFVRVAVDDDGASCFVPLDSPRMRLVDRVRSLLAADYLAAPYEYVDLFVCHRCEAVMFDADAKRTGICRRHRLQSGVVVRNNDDVNDDARDVASCIDAGFPRARARSES